ncbi:DNA polymerase [Acidimicrobiaceae bacterium]|nr:DNA polymerase [Acidimicrobiaceae bacterium]
MIILVDGHSIAFRAFYALPDTLVTKDGFPTNVIHGFLMMISKLVKDYDSEQIIITWDISKKTFRTELYSEYKGNRSSAPEEFKLQVKTLQELLDKFNIPQVSKEGFEADDVLGTLSKKLNDKDKEVMIVTGDRDSFQLITDKTKILYTKRGISDTQIFNEKQFTDKYSIRTNQYIEYLALKGDPSDNIPGLPGVGEKTAINLLLKYENIRNIYKNLDDLTPKLKETFLVNRDLLDISKTLATIKKDLEIDIPNTKTSETIFLDNLVLNTVEGEILKYELSRFLGERNSKVKDKPKDKIEIEKFSKKIKDKSLIFIFNDSFYFVNQNTYGEFEDITIFDKVISLSSQRFSLLNNSKLKHDKFIAFDCMLFLEDPSIKPDSILNIIKYLDSIAIINKKSTIDEVIMFFQSNYESICKKVEKFNKNSKLLQIYKDIDYPMLEILSEMEIEGITVSKSKMSKLSKKLAKQLVDLKSEAFLLSKKEFNLNSPKQLSEIFYNELNYPIIKKTPKGAPSTDASVLEELSKDYELPKIILKYRELEKIRSTYVDGLIPEVTDDGKIHTHFNLFGTATGRLSSEKPNLQNIPNKTDLGQQIRDFFIVEPSKKFVISDYSQIELRVLAHLSKDSDMTSILKDKDSDIHSETASRIFDTKLSEVTSDMRRKAKEVNFGLIYGMEAFGLSKSLNISQKEASELIASYFNQFPKIKGFLDGVVVQAEADTYTTTLLGRKRYIRELSSSNFQVKAAGRRIAMNAPIQGTASDIMKIAMIKVSNRLNKIDGANLLLQIHDELIVETDEVNLDKVKAIVTQEMESALTLEVPLFVNTKVSESLANFNK